MTTIDTTSPPRPRYRFLLAALASAGLALAAPTAASADTRPATDPFVVLLEPPARPAPPAPPPDVVTLPRPAPPPPPLMIELLGFVQDGDSGEALAVIEYRGREYVVGDGWSGDPDDSRFDGRFRVVEVGREHLEVYDSRTQARKTFGS